MENSRIQSKLVGIRKQFTNPSGCPGQPADKLTSLIDPARLATPGQRVTNQRSQKTGAILADAKRINSIPVRLRGGDYRRPATEKGTGLLHYRVDTRTFSDITGSSYPINTSSRAWLNQSLKNFRFAKLRVRHQYHLRAVNFGGGSSGDCYIFGVANSSAADFPVRARVTATDPSSAPPAFKILTCGNDKFQCTVPGTSGPHYVLQVSTNLNAPNWISLTTNARCTLPIEPNAGLFNQR